VAEAYTIGWQATRWIPAGVGVYMGFLLLAPRLHALGKQRGYMTVSELLFDRYLPPSGSPWVRQGGVWA
jgi:Na+/proline symporter